ncbi:MAG: hypothetical protein QG597_5119 [Actinomycetota bacterium]|nr:hypothetical protein [Actinomycetota bacterium]
MLRGLRWEQFLVLEYDAEEDAAPLPYAQAARDPDNWYVELVSGNYLPASAWPLDEVLLRRQGWSPPDRETANWWAACPRESAVARALVAGLRDGRSCADSHRYCWSVGTFPDGPRGGEPVPVPPSRFEHHLLAA